MKYAKMEMHITMRSYDDGMQPEYKRLEKHLEDTGWKPSRIDGDPRLGAGVKMYATGHLETTRGRAKKELIKMAGELKSAGFKVIRAKLEEIVFDQVYNEQSN
jgi:hypothetical protein